MPLWKDGSLFDSSPKNTTNDEPQPSSDAGKKDDESGIDDQEKPEDSSPDVNTVGLNINNASINTGSLNINTASPPVTTTPLEATHVGFFGDETELDMSNISTTYPLPTTPNPNTNPKKVIQALKDPNWIEGMQEELLQFKLQQVWTLVDLPYDKRAIGTKWVYRNKKDEIGIVARLVAQGYTQEEGINYDEIFAPVAMIEAIRLFLAYSSFKDFVVYQMDVKSAFPYGKIKEKVYVCQPPGFEDPEFLDKVYKVEKALYGLHQAPKACQDKYVDEILKKFGFSTMKTTSTPMETSKPLLKDAEAEDVDVHLYRSMIRSLMYLTTSRPDIMFVVCACARFQVTPKGSHLHVVKRIFRYLKGQPKLGLWYPKDSPFDLEAYTEVDYAGASLDRKSTTGGCQFLRRRLISWQCRSNPLVANSSTDVDYVAVLVVGHHFSLDNESPSDSYWYPSGHSTTKHIEIRHHFIRDSNEKKLIQMIKIHTDHNVADLLTKAFDARRFQYLITRFQEIVDFLNGSHIRYALTKNPTIYVSLIKKFWQTATVRIVDNGEQEITVIVDCKKFTITEASVRRDLQLADVDDKDVYEEWDDRVERATTTAASLDAEQASGNINRTQSMTRSERVPTSPRDSPLLRVHILRSDEGSMTLQELTVLCTTLSKKVESLEADLKQTKQVYGAAYTKLIIKRRMIEEIDEDAGVTLGTPTQGEDQLEDQLGVLSATKVLADASKTYTRRRREISTSSGGISTASRLFSTAKESVSTAGASMLVSIAGMVQEVNISIPSPVVIKDKGKGKMEESKDKQIKRTKLHQEQDRLGHKAAEEWENIRARVEANEELSRRLQAEERNNYSEVDQAKMLLAAGSSQATIIDSAEVRSTKRDVEAELDHEGSKRQKTNEDSGLVQEQPK
ncbi:putative reverse transcriptase, RNA-dependent DNA polymerase [Tanacetum coccineum]